MESDLLAKMNDGEKNSAEKLLERLFWRENGVDHFIFIGLEPLFTHHIHV